MYKKALDQVFNIVIKICMALLAIFLAVVVVAVFFRYVLNNSLTWSEQVSRFLFVWMIMLMLPIMYREKRDISFDVITKRLSDVPKEILELVMDCLVTAFGAFFGYQDLIYTLEYGEKLISGVNIPQWMLYVSEPISGLLLTLVGVECVLADIKSMRSGKEVK